MASTIKVNNIQNQCGANIANKCGSTITLGASGDTITLACGASQTGFGRTGTVDWDTTAKTASFTAVSGNGYFVNTTSGAVTVTLPAGSAGAIVSLADYTNTWQTNAVTVTPNGSEKIGGVNAPAALSTTGQSVTFVYVDATEGWKSVQDSTSNVIGNPNIEATGGTITTSGDYKIHTFTGPGTFTVTNASSTPANNIVSYLVVAGGAAGGTNIGGGGGAGGFREYKGPADCYTASPLNGNPGGTAVTVTATSYPITVGGGGTGTPYASVAGDGSNSIFSTITSAGGGGGGGDNPNSSVGSNGGSGGGGGYQAGGQPGGTGNTPPTTPPQGTNGGTGLEGPPAWSAAGGGGATDVGTNAPPSGGGPGGDGATTSISGTPTTYAGGGAGSGSANNSSPGGTGGPGGGGNGGSGPLSPNGTAGTANTGGGGGGRANIPSAPLQGPGLSGGSGIVIIRYKYQ